MNRLSYDQAITIVTLCLLVGLGIVLRAASLGREAAWGDETLTVACFPADSFTDYIDKAFALDDVPKPSPLYYVVQYSWSVFFGGGLLSLRWLSISLYCIAALQLYGLVRSIGGHRAGLWALFFFGVSLFEIYYGQEVRFYALMNVFALAGIQGALLYIRGRRYTGLALAFVGNACLVLTHIFGIALVLGLGLYMLRYIRRPKMVLPWWCAHAVMAFMFLAWLAWLRYDINAKSAAYHDMTAGWRELANTFLQFSGGRFSNANPAPYMPGGVSLDKFTGVLALLLTGGAIAQAFQGRHGPSKHRQAGEMFLLLAALVLPVLILYIEGRVWKPYFFPRYVLYCALPLYALMALCLGGIRSNVLRQCAAVIVVGLFAWQSMALPRPFRADYGAVHRAVSADESEEKLVLALKTFNHRAVDFTLRDSGVPTELILGLKEIVRVSAEQAAAGKSVWAVFYRWDQLDEFESRVKATGMEVRRLQSSGMPPLTLFHVTERQ